MDQHNLPDPDPNNWTLPILEATISGILIEHGAANGDQDLIERKAAIFAAYEAKCDA